MFSLPRRLIYFCSQARTAPASDFAAAACVSPPSEHFTFQSAKRQNPEPVKRPLTPSFTVARMSITRVPTPANSLDPDSLFSRKHSSDTSVVVSAEVSIVCAEDEGRLSGVAASQPVGARVTEWAPSCGCRGYALSFGVCACAAPPSPAATSDLVHSEEDNYSRGTEKKRDAKTSEQLAGGTREESPSLNPPSSGSNTFWCQFWTGSPRRERCSLARKVPHKRVQSKNERVSRYENNEF